MNKLINQLIKDGYLKTDSIIEAFSEINRIEFVPEEFENQANANVALPIGYGQTISQPLTVAFMLELLSPQKGQKILDIGSGSGWTAALLSHIVGEQGKVYALDVKEELTEFGKNNVDKFGYVKKGIAEFSNTNGVEGLPEKAPFDCILVSASAKECPQSLKDQLKVGGKMVIPIGDAIHFMEKKGEQEFEEKEFPGFSFVPMVQE
jgi:protein-L-isoaspartate(D-aspartate) O-methyltransferase